MRRMLSTMLRRLTAPLFLAIVVAAAVAAPTSDDAVELPETQPVLGVQGQVHYLPWDANQFLATLEGQNANVASISSPVRLITSIVSALDGNDIYVDHWEDGYDADAIAAPGPTTELFQLDEGESQVLNNLVDVPRPDDSTAPIRYDGGDKLVSTGAIVVTSGGWASGSGTLHAGAAAVRNVNSAGFEFVSPVGQDTTYPAPDLASLWDYVGLVIVATQDGTTVTLPDGSTVDLDEGDSHLVNGGVQLGDTVTADLPVSVFLSTGDPAQNYEGRMFGLLPTEAWSDSYATPVGSRDSNNRTRVFLYNPGSSAISVTYTESGGATGSLTVPAGGQANRLVSNNVGSRFSSPGNPFYALQAVTTPEGTDTSSAHNWGFALTPERLLTPMVVVGYAPGSDDFDANGSVDANDSAVWISPQEATTVYVDLDADPDTGANTDPNGNQYDFSCAGTALTPILIKDVGAASCSSIATYTRAGGTGDNDMTGARVYTTDGVPLAAAWGQVPGAANTGTPAIDMGTTVLPFPTIDLDKSSEIVDDDGDGEALPGDTIRYTVTITNRGISPVDDLELSDQLPDHVSYVPGTLTAGGSAIPDPAGSTPFPLDEDGLLVPPVLGVGETRTVTYDLLVDDPLPPGVSEILNEITLASDYGTYTDGNVQPVVDPGSVGDRVWDDADGDGVQDPSEVGLVGVTVGLLDGDGNEIDSTVTGTDGTYVFETVYPGTYAVRIDTTSLAPGLAPTSDLDGIGSAHEAAVAVAQAEDRTDVDFGYATSTLTLDKTVYSGHDAGAGCPAAGSESVTGENGDPVTFCFTVTNTGVLSMTDVELDDPTLGITEADLEVESGSAATLAPGASVVFSYSGASVVGDVTNTATATATVGGQTRSATDTAEVTVLGPGISLAKTVYRGHDGGASCGTATESVTARTGGPVTYCFLVANSGETNLSAVTFSDADLDIASGAQTHALLTPGQSHTFHVETTVDGDLTNTATASGTSPAGVQPTADDTASVDEIHPAIEVRKSIVAGDSDGAGCPGVEELVGRTGDAVTWCFVVENVGDAPLTDVTLDDLPLGVDESDLTLRSGSLSSLAPAETAVLYLEVPSVTDDVDNDVTATGVAPVGADVTDTDTAALEVIEPSLSLAKSAYVGDDEGAGCATATDSLLALPGDAVTWCFTITNTGDADLTDLRLDDPDLGIDESDAEVLAGSLDALAPGESVTLWFADGRTVDGDLDNTATATGTPPAGPDVTAEDVASIDEVNAAIHVEKTVYGGHDAGDQCDTAGDGHADEAGAPVTWCFTVTNTGDATLTDVTIDDADLGVDESDLEVVSGSLAGVPPGGSVVAHLEGSVDGDLTNRATVAGTPPVGPDVTDDDEATVDELVPAVTLDKTVYRGHDGGASCQGTDSVVARAGDDVTWCLLVTNSGDTDLSVEVTDADLGFSDTLDLGPGESETLHVEGTVDGDLTNTASATGTSPGGQTVEDEDEATADEIHPELTLDKAVYLGGGDGGAGCATAADSVEDEAGQPVTWCFTITNSGDSPLTDITVEDLPLEVDQDDLTVVSGDLDDLEAGESVVLAFEDTVEGDLLNLATAAATPQAGPDVTDEDAAGVALLVPGITVDKAVYRGHDSGAGCATASDEVVGQAGDDVTWCFTVTNTGDVPLTVDVSDPQTAFTDTIVGLAPGATTTVFDQDVIDGDLSPNVVTVTGETPDDDEVTDTDEASSDEIHPAIEVEKTVYSGHDGGASCAGTDVIDAEVGEAVTWCFTITNTSGDAALTDLTLDDAVLGIDESDVSGPAGAFDALAPGASVTVHVEDVAGGATVNNVTVGGTAPDGSTPTATDGAEIDAIAPQIGIAKTVVDGPTGNGDGTYTLTYRLRVGNAGETLLEGVQVSDDLTETFAGARDFEVDLVESADFTLDPGYDGRPSGSTDLLAGTDTLAVGEVGDILLTVTLDPGDDRGPYENTAHATGASPVGDVVEDDSDSGSVPDPGDPNSGEPGDTSGTDDPVPFEIPAVDLTVTKGVHEARPTGDGSAVIDWRIVVTNDGPGDDPGPITVTDELDERLSYVSASGDDWACDVEGQVVACTWDGPLAAGESTSEIQVLTDAQATGSSETTFRNGVHVASTLTEARTDNNEAAAEVDAEWVDDPGAPSSLPRTGATVGGLLLLGLGLVLGGRLLQRRARGVVA